MQNTSCTTSHWSEASSITQYRAPPFFSSKAQSQPSQSTCFPWSWTHDILPCIDSVTKFQTLWAKLYLFVCPLFSVSKWATEHAFAPRPQEYFDNEMKPTCNRSVSFYLEWLETKKEKKKVKTEYGNKKRKKSNEFPDHTRNAHEYQRTRVSIPRSVWIREELWLKVFLCTFITFFFIPGFSFSFVILFF